MMKRFCFLVLVFVFSSALADETSNQQLVGEWVVDLRPLPDAEPYLQTFEVLDVDGNRFSGRFYGTRFEDGVINSTWGSVQFAFTTADGRTSYHHSGELRDGVISGRTHAPGRTMLSIWSATKAVE